MRRLSEAASEIARRRMRGSKERWMRERGSLRNGMETAKASESGQYKYQSSFQVSGWTLYSELPRLEYAVHQRKTGEDLSREAVQRREQGQLNSQVRLWSRGDGAAT